MTDHHVRPSLAGRPTWLPILQIVLWTTALPILADVASSAEPGDQRLRILPDDVTVAADHPAQVVVLYQRPDGTQQDVTEQAELSVDDPALVRIDQARVAHAVAEGRTRLIATWRGWRARATIRVASIEPLEPRFPFEVSAVLFKAGCNLGTCHGNLHGKAGFRLSLRGDDPRFDYDAITRGARGRRIDWFDPERSLLLRKPSGDLAHQGGLRLPVDSPGYEVLQRWLAAGAQWDADAGHAAPPGQQPLAADDHQAEAATKLVALNTADAGSRDAGDGNIPATAEARVRTLQVYPAQAWLAPKARSQRLVVVAELADGTRRDVTRWTRFEASELAGVSVSEGGQVTVDRPVDVTISAHYLDGKAQARLVFLQRSRPLDATPPPSAQPIDRLVEQRLQQMRIPAAPPAAPEVFLRRLFLVTAGRLPTAEETRDYLADDRDDAKRRGEWIERALADPGYADLWALHFSDLLRNEPKTMSLEGATRWNAWFAQRFRNDDPLDAVVHDLLATVGSTYENPPASFHRTHREPAVAAEAVGQVFLGVRIQCAQCHNHPFDVWKQDDYYGLAAYFTTIRRKQIDNAPRDRLDSHVITGDEIISLADQPPRIEHPGLAMEVPPKPLDQAGWDAADDALTGQDDDPLQRLADWLTRDNRAFARNMANRIWYHVMGRGIVDPPDDFRGSNPPSNPELLEYLTDRLIDTGYSTRTVMREILASDTFARQSVTQSTNLDGLNAAAVFAGYPLRRMSAEVMLDAICDVTGVAPRHEPPRGEAQVERAVRYAGASGDGFLKSFGRPDRLLSCECERSGDASLTQALLLVNGPDVRERIAARPNRIDRVLGGDADARRWIETLYLAALTRLPSAEESRVMALHVAQAASDREAAEDILWALINSQEFLWIR